MPAVLNAIVQEIAGRVIVQFCVPLLTVIVPEGVPAPGAVTSTCEVNVTVCPTTDGLISCERFVVVAALLTVCVNAADCGEAL